MQFWESPPWPILPGVFPMASKCLCVAIIINNNNNKALWLYIGEKKTLQMNVLFGKIDSRMQKYETRASSDTKINSKWVKDLDKRSETRSHKEVNISHMSISINLKVVFWDLTPNKIIMITNGTTLVQWKKISTI